MGCSQDREEKPPVSMEEFFKNNKYALEGVTGIRPKLIGIVDTNEISKVYEFVREIGRGISGDVWEVEKIGTKKRYAMKRIKKHSFLQGEFEKMKEEIQFLKEMDHPNTIKLFDTFEDEQMLYMIMEECVGGELFDKIDKYEKQMVPEPESAHIIIQMLKAICYLHNKNICHRDLKLENFIFEDQSENSKLKLIDFGLSHRYCPGVSMTSQVGTIFYMAPEILSNNEYGIECDMWSLGVITYMLLFGIPPFNDLYEKEIENKIKKGRYDFSIDRINCASAESKDFIAQLLKVKPQERMTVHQALNHSWIIKHRNLEKPIIQIELLNAMKRFCSFSKLKQCLLQIISFNLHPNDIKNLRDQYEKIDVDGNGVVTLQELKDAAVNAGIKESELDFPSLFRILDTNNTGLLSYTEFITATMGPEIYLKPENLLEAFQKLDRNGNGLIEISELSDILDGQFKAEEIDNMLKFADIDKNGQVDFNDFVAVMRGQTVNISKNERSTSKDKMEISAPKNDSHGDEMLQINEILKPEKINESDQKLTDKSEPPPTIKIAQKSPQMSAKISPKLEPKSKSNPKSKSPGSKSSSSNSSSSNVSKSSADNIPELNLNDDKSINNKKITINNKITNTNNHNDKKLSPKKNSTNQTTRR